MRAGLEATATIAANLGLIHDPRVGILRRVAEVSGNAAPDFIHFIAETSDPAALGGSPGPFEATAAASDRETAMARAVRRALARYAAALYERAGLPLATVADAGFRCVPPGDFALNSAVQYAKPGFPYVPFGEDTPVRWTGTVDLTSGETVYMPAALVWLPYPWLRAGGDLPIGEPTATGLACAESLAAAKFAGLCDVVACDALALFWQTATAPPQLRLGTLPEGLRSLVARFEAAGDAVAVVDITTNNRLPSFAAVAMSNDPEQPAFAFGAASDLDPEAAVEAALLDLAATRRLAAEVKRKRPPPAAANEWEDVIDWADHLGFAADHANRAALAFAVSSEDRRDLGDYDRAATGEIDADLEICVARVSATGCRPYAADLTSEDVGALGLTVVRVVVPGYHPLLAGHRARALGGERLYDVPQKLGYRGIFRGSAGNPAPHPFAGER